MLNLASKEELLQMKVPFGDVIKIVNARKK
jgi:hypothetical protein